MKRFLSIMMIISLFSFSSCTSSSDSNINSTNDSINASSFEASVDNELWNDTNNVHIDNLSIAIPAKYELIEKDDLYISQKYINTDKNSIIISTVNITDDINENTLIKYAHTTKNSYETTEHIWYSYEVISSKLVEICGSPAAEIKYKVTKTNNRKETLDTYDELALIVKTNKLTIRFSLTGELTSTGNYSTFCSLIKPTSDSVATTKQQTTANKETEPDIPIEYINALNEALFQLKYTAFSKQWLKEQLEYQKYSSEAATYAVEHCGADWNEQAVKKARSHLNDSYFTKKKLIEKLEYEGFTATEAKHGADVAYK